VAVDDLSSMGLANKIPVPSETTDSPGGEPLAFGLYVHVPFCAHACDFCAFYQEEPRRERIALYLRTIEREMALVPARRCDTAFWGGGTPGVLPARDLARAGRAQLQRFGPPVREWTVELAPGSIKRDKLRVLRELGVTRVSLGVQSLSPRTLEALGRRHSPTQIREALALVREAGFRSINLDLIFAVPGQSLAEWEDDLGEAVRLGPDHISTYCLTLEDDTALFMRLGGAGAPVDLERERAFYLQTWEVLEASGFGQYEISNFARPGHACLHNLNTWRMQTWAGLGPSAASQDEDGRGANAADLAAWAAAVDRGGRAGVDRMRLHPGQLAEDALIFGLRMNDGVDLAALERRFGRGAFEPFGAAISGFVADGLAGWHDGRRLALTREGRLVADRMGAELIGLGGRD
jgi:oxygen-independent coproporphyrinogen III oxidase